jgi:hypothetical protein
MRVFTLYDYDRNVIASFYFNGDREALQQTCEYARRNNFYVSQSTPQFINDLSELHDLIVKTVDQEVDADMGDLSIGDEP